MKYRYGLDKTHPRNFYPTPGWKLRAFLMIMFIIWGVPLLLLGIIRVFQAL